VKNGKFCSQEKLAKVHSRSPDLPPIDRPHTSFYRHAIVTMVLDCFVSEISDIAGIANATFAIPLCLPPKILRCFPKVRSISSVIARFLG